jgi:hypothetical protein
MSEAARPRLVFLGLPRTGKSTFLGAFWALIQSPAETSVREASFSGDRSYVQRLAEQVARGEELDRTALGAGEELSVEVRFEPEGLAQLVIPDTSGESLRVLAERRIWYPRLLEACTNATAILVFINPERLRMPQRIAVAVGGGQAEPEVAAERMPGEVQFHPGDPIGFQAQEHACTAAELIDVFENIAELWRDRRSIRVGVVVSAWDRVGGDPRLTPYEWMGARLPGVLGTLESNRDIADFEVFGVSAQGGTLEDRDELLARGEICDRVFAEDRDGRSVSLVDPIRWAIWGS